MVRKYENCIVTLLIAVIFVLSSFLIVAAQQYQHQHQHQQQQHHQQHNQFYTNRYQQPSAPRQPLNNNQSNDPRYTTYLNYTRPINYYTTPVPIPIRPHTTTYAPPYYTTNRYVPTQHQRQPPKPVSYAKCDVPPDFWCDSWEMAQRCGVVQQCEQFKRDRKPITVTLMYEALCPFCQRFITNHLGTLYDTFRGKVDLELVPWGNSRLLRNGQISCNHGQAECDANRLMSCVIDVVKVKQAIPFVVCFERQLGAYPQVEQALHHCSTFIRNAHRQIRDCYDGERGKQLQRQAAYRTMNIRAHPIIEVPYIVVNNYSPSVNANGINIMSLQYLLNKWINLKV